jgi:hypothetical protein
MTCSIEGCGGEAVAKGLCAKHYMRQRRGGDPTVRRKPGPKISSSSWAITLEKTYPHWSARTKARYASAMQILGWLHHNHGVDIHTVLDAATFRNGEPNVSRLLKMVRERARRIFAENPSLLDE